MPTYRYEGDQTRVYPSVHRSDGSVLDVVPGETVTTIEEVNDPQRMVLVVPSVAPPAPETAPEVPEEPPAAPTAAEPESDPS